MSFTKGLSFHHETNSVSQPTINNNISISASNELSQSNPNVIVEHKEVEKSLVERENEFLRKVLTIYMSQRFYFSGKYIVLTSEELLELLQTLLPDKSIVITSRDIDDIGCCGFVKDVPLKKVESIWVNEGDQQTSFKYGYSNLVALLDTYKVSIKFVRVV